MAKDRDAIDKAVEAFKQYQARGKVGIKASVDRIRALQEAQKAESTRLGITRG